ncbi:transcriptional activator RfaH [Candidatus Puniceispirillum sp.]|nr:transcriptional activator RfaH [Candidatus Puniceispirillum sp.]
MYENDDEQKAHNKRWYLAQCKPNATHIAVRNLDNQGFKSFLPLHEGTIRKGTGFHHQIRSLFPGYLFIQLDASEGPWRKINSTRGIARLVCLGTEPSVVPDAIIAGLMARCNEMGIIQGADTLSVGNRVQVTQGPFAGFVATIADFEADARINILLDIMGQSTNVSIEATALAPLD